MFDEEIRQAVLICPARGQAESGIVRLAEEGATHVITRYRDTNANLRTQLLRIVEKAGVEPWQKSFQNLRSYRETELTNQFPIHAVADWLGNTPQVTDKHYLQTTEQHFQQAADCADTVQNCANSVAEQQSTAEQQTKKTPTDAEVCLSNLLAAPPCFLAEYPLGESNPCCRTENPES